MMLKIRISSQQGAATLLSAILIVLLSILGIYTLNRGVISEIRMVSDLNRSQEALQAAESGLTCGISKYFELDGANLKYDINSSDVASIESECKQRINTSTNPDAPLDRLQFCDYNPATPPEDINTLLQDCTNAFPTSPTVILVATGKSADGSATRIVSMVFAGKESGLRLGSLAPLTISGATGSLTGNATVINNDSNVTIWTGENLSGLSGSFETQITVDGQPNQISSTKDGSNINIGPDVITGDANLANLSSDNFERLALLKTFEDYSKSTADKVIDMAGPPALTASDVEALLDNMATEGWRKVAIKAPTTTTIKIDTDLGALDKPIVLAIQGGSIEFSGSPTVRGVIFASGKVDFKGGGTVYGAVVASTVEGPPGKGNFKIIADSNAMAQVEELLDPSRAAISATWRDW